MKSWSGQIRNLDFFVCVFNKRSRVRGDYDWKSKWFLLSIEFYRSQVRIVMVLKVKVRGLICHCKLYSYSFFFFHEPPKENLNNHLAALSITAHSEHIFCKHQQIYIKAPQKMFWVFFFCRVFYSFLWVLDQYFDINNSLFHYHMTFFQNSPFMFHTKTKLILVWREYITRRKKWCIWGSIETEVS